MQGEFGWVRLAILLEVRKEPVGVWLFGRRDPDDYYPQKDIKLLETLASQVAISVEDTRLYLQLRSAITSKDEMIQNVSHELRTPLTLMMGYIELVKDGIFDPISPELKNAVDILDVQTNRLYYMVDRLLTLQTLEQRKFERTELELESWLQQVTQPWQARARRAGIEIHLAVPPDLPCILADPDLLNHVVSNLLDNAIKFTQIKVR